MNQTKVGCCGSSRGKKEASEQFRPEKPVMAWSPLEIRAAYEKPRCCHPHGAYGYRHQWSDDDLASLLELSHSGAPVRFNNTTMYDDALRAKQLVQSDR